VDLSRERRKNSVAEFLFVYGSLLSNLNHPMHRIIEQKAVLVGRARVSGSLYDLGDYPGLIIHPELRTRVWGEVYRFDEQHPLLDELDAYEECGPSKTRSGEYRRRRVVARLMSGGGRVEAWVYEYRGPLRGHTPIRGGDYLKYLNRAA
jgi:gamma-glutamylcyclotransferase (GGCT)/AIG2-like uncharacterized protein YtfP